MTTTTAFEDLAPLVSPRSVAVIGASDQPQRIGGRILARLKETFTGPIVPVNASRDTVQGLPAYRDITDAPEPVDLAIIAAPSPQVPAIVADCAAHGTGAALVLSAGFAETGEAGRRAQDEIVAAARTTGMRVCGPNCIGIMNLTVGLRTVFSTITNVPQEPGGLAVVSQSGGFGMSLFAAAQNGGLGTSYMCATGNEADVTCSELVGYLAERPDVRVIALFCEGVRNPDLLLRGARRALELDKPIVALRTGRSAVGARAAASHTGTIVSADDVLDAAFGRSGIVRVDGPAELVEFAKLFAGGRRTYGRRLAIVTSSGGSGVLMSDVAETCGVEMPEPAEKLAGELGGLVPSFGSVRNPIDATAQVVNDQSMLAKLFATVAAADDYDMVCVSGAPSGLGPGLLDTIEAAATGTEKPFAVWAAERDVAQNLMRRGVPAIPDPNLTIRALGALGDYTRRRADALVDPFPVGRPMPADGLVDEPHALAEHEARRYVVDAGVPVPDERLVASADDARAALRELDGPVAVKLSAPWLTHKSEHGAVRLGVATEDAVAIAFTDLAGLAAGLRPAGGADAAVVVQAMAPSGTELICGGFHDPTFGPVVTIGLGGTLVEIVRDRRLNLAPLPQDEAERMVRALAGGRLVGHARGLTEAAATAVAGTLVRLGELLCARPEVAEVELNPVICHGDDVTAVDALVSVREG